jgi:hypothetical protein
MMSPKEQEPQARQCHILGPRSIFLTVSFDDDQCLLTQGLSGVEVDNDDDIMMLTEAELKGCCTKPLSIRVDFPGVTAISSEILLNIMIEEVIGWDMKNNKATGEAELFGKPFSLSLSIEEHGRRTLHGHMMTWI